MFAWSTDDPPLHGRYRLEWDFRGSSSAGAEELASNPAQTMEAVGIVQRDDPRLGRRARPFRLPEEAEDARRVITALDSAAERVTQVHVFGKGMGIAAPQIGIDRAAALIRPAGGRDSITLLNPRIIEVSVDTDEQHEGCQRPHRALDRDCCGGNGVSLLEGCGVDPNRPQAVLGPLKADARHRRHKRHWSAAESPARPGRRVGDAASEVDAEPCDAARCNGGNGTEQIRVRGRCEQRQLRALRATHQAGMAAPDLGLPPQPLAGGCDGLEGDLAQRRGQWLDPEVRRRQHGNALAGEERAPP